MNKIIQVAGLLVAMALSASAAFYDFNKGDGEWGDTNLWTIGTGGATPLPASPDTARIDAGYSCTVTSGITGTAARVVIGGFSYAGTLIVNAGGALSLGAGDNTVATSRKTGVLDVSGEFIGTGYLTLGGSSSSTGTVEFKPGAEVSLGFIRVGNGSADGSYSVTQTGGSVQLSGDLVIADVNDSISTGTYAISAGTLRAKRLNTGGNGTSTAKFSVQGSDAEISFFDQSWIGGQTALEFVLDAAGVSALMMTNGGYTVSSLGSLTVDGSAFYGSTGDGILLIGTTNTPATFNAANVTLSAGYGLDYREDGLYLTGGTNELTEINPAVLFIDSGSESVTVSATGLTAAATYSLDSSADLTSTNWTSAALVTGVSETNWVFSATNPAMFYRMESQ
jgi:hypothetical protein